MQSKLESLIETLTNTFVGFVGSWLITYTVTLNYEAEASVKATVIVVLCTVWSLVRSYFIRRRFNAKYLLHSSR